MTTGSTASGEKYFFANTPTSITRCPTRFTKVVESIKPTFLNGAYDEVLNTVQWLMRQPEEVVYPPSIANALKSSRAAYRVLDEHPTIVPITSEVELATLNKAFSDLRASPFHGARAHLIKAAGYLTNGAAADCIRESMHAVESVARVIAGDKSLAGALKKIGDRHGLHEALQRGFKALYGFTSDEKGLRHPLLDDPGAKVDETDAIFMLGACAAFVSYLIARSTPTA